VVYAAADCEAGRRMPAHVGRFAALLKEFGGAGAVETRVLGLA